MEGTEGKEYSLLISPETGEMLEMVLVHLDAEERHEAACASPAFYEALCRLERNKKLKLDVHVSLFINV